MVRGRSAALLLLLLTLGVAAEARAAQVDASTDERRPSASSVAALQFAVGAGAALLATPASLALGGWIATGSSNLFLSALPALLLVLAGPPLAVVFAERWVGDRFESGRFRISPAVWAALATQAVVLVGAILLGANALEFRDAAIFTAVDVVALPLVTTLVMRATRADGAAQAAAPQSLARVELPRVWSLPVISWAF